MGAGGLEGELGELGEVERGEGVGDAVGVGNSVLDGEAHVAMAELGEDAAVLKLDHAMDDALGVDDDVDFCHGDIEQPFGFDHFEAFVKEGGGVDGDFAAHVPGGVFEGLGEGDVGELVSGEGAEGAAAGGEEEAADGIAVLAFEALEDGVVLAIDGEKADAFGGGGGGDGLAGHDEDFFASDGEIHAAVDGGEGGGEARGADDGDEDEIGLDGMNEVDEALGTRIDVDGGGQGGAGFGGCGGIEQGEVLDAGLLDLGEDSVHAGVGGKADDFHAVRQGLGDLEGASADGAGGTEQEDTFFGG